MQKSIQLTEFHRPAQKFNSQYGRIRYEEWLKKEAERQARYDSRIYSIHKNRDGEIALFARKSDAVKRRLFDDIKNQIDICAVPDIKIKTVLEDYEMGRRLQHVLEANYYDCTLRETILSIEKMYYAKNSGPDTVMKFGDLVMAVAKRNTVKKNGKNAR